MNKWLTAIFTLIFLYLLGSLIAYLFLNNEDLFGDKIVIIPINGVITTNSDNSNYFSFDGVSSTTLVKDIKELNEDESVKGIIFEIDSPGGGAVASQEIAEAIKKIKKPKYAVIRETGASGGYWIASATDKIIANPMSITGSIGVIASYLEFSKLFEKYGVNYERLISGNYKDIGSPFRELNDEERKILETKLEIIHDYFIKAVAENRNLDADYVRTLATGEFYLGSEAKSLGLVDELGNRETALEMMKKEMNVTDIEIIEKKHETGILDLLTGKVSYNFGRGFGKSFLEYNLKNNPVINV